LVPQPRQPYIIGRCRLDLTAEEHIALFRFVKHALGLGCRDDPDRHERFVSGKRITQNVDTVVTEPKEGRGS
jgi:hypothetical protein